MNFCTNCDNMYYIKLNEEENELVYYCRNCGNVDNSPTENSLVISSANFKNEDAFISSFINSYTKHDPTLPRTNLLKCPNNNCSSNVKSEDNDKTDKNSEIICIRYDAIELKYIYLCSYCDTAWK
jgi:DNA-directed RNA polymerase subunit M/transcription elongation factor TFIIS